MLAPLSHCCTSPPPCSGPLCSKGCQPCAGSSAEMGEKRHYSAARVQQTTFQWHWNKTSCQDNSLKWISKRANSCQRTHGCKRITEPQGAVGEVADTPGNVCMVWPSGVCKGPLENAPQWKRSLTLSRYNSNEYTFQGRMKKGHRLLTVCPLWFLVLFCFYLNTHEHMKYERL